MHAFRMRDTRLGMVICWKRLRNVIVGSQQTKMIIDLYSRPIAYTEDDEHIYLFSGAPVAYLSGDAVYAFGGQQLGWFEDGWIRDKKGGCVLFTEDARGGPVKPVRRVKPVKGVKRIKPVKSVKRVKSVKAVKILCWSPYRASNFSYELRGCQLPGRQLNS